MKRLIPTRSTSTWLPRLILGGSLALTLGCKKPKVEVEEEGPPLPIDPRAPAGQTTGGPAPAGTAPATGGPGAPGAAPVLTVETACAAVDAHMTSIGRDTTGRECFGLRTEGGGFRLTGYSLPKTPAPVTLWEAFPICLWEKDDGTGFRFAYADGGTPCRLPSDYCRLGAPGARYSVSTAACPGDDALAPNEASTLSSLTGRWAPASGQGGSLVIFQDGQVHLSVGDVTHDGTLELGRRGTGQLVQAAAATRVGFALTPRTGARPSTLYFGFGDVAGTANRAGFIAEPQPGRRVRRYEDGCFIVDPAAELAPAVVKCTAQDSGLGPSVSFTLDGAETTYTYVGSAWVASEVLSWAWERVGDALSAPAKTAEPAAPDPVPPAAKPSGGD